MKQRRGLFAALLLVGAVVLWWLFKPPASTSPSESNGGAPSTAAPGRAVSVVQPPSPLERSTLADALNAPTADIRADLRLVSSIVDTFRSNFLQTGNPVGTNAEITAALTGRNRLSLVLIPPDHRAINSSGELCDRWGTPFFFHAESATRMEIRSAGPDRKLWSEDDVAISP